MILLERSTLKLTSNRYSLVLQVVLQVVVTGTAGRRLPLIVLPSPALVTLSCSEKIRCPHQMGKNIIFSSFHAVAEHIHAFVGLFDFLINFPRKTQCFIHVKIVNQHFKYGCISHEKVLILPVAQDMIYTVHTWG